MAFKLRSGSTSAFKMMGSSPAKQDKVNPYKDQAKKQPVPFAESNAIEKIKEYSGPQHPTEESGPPVMPDEQSRTTSPKSKGKANATQTKAKIPAALQVPKRPGFTPPTTEESAKSKGTLKGVTGFEYDVVNPVKGKIRQGIKFLKDNIITNTAKKMIKTDKERVKKVKDYFTKK